jgi:heme oxygenase
MAILTSGISNWVRLRSGSSRGGRDEVGRVRAKPYTGRAGAGMNPVTEPQSLSSLRRDQALDQYWLITNLQLAPPHSVPRSCVGRGSASRWLRTQTRDEHVAVEAELDFGRLHDRAALAGLLRGWDAVWGAVLCAGTLPGACRQASEELLVAAVQARRWIRSDLASIGGHRASDLDVVQRAEDSTHLANLLAVPADSWGVAYVLRGSRLGGTVLAVRVSAALGLPPDCGTKFLASAGTEPGRDWVAFRRRLDGLDLSPAELGGAVDAARWTFGWVGAVTVGGVRAGRALPR